MYFICEQISSGCRKPVAPKGVIDRLGPAASWRLSRASLGTVSHFAAEPVPAQQKKEPVTLEAFASLQALFMTCTAKDSNLQPID